jgi:tetratricopeptide (TPR) repeat protein
VLLARDERSLPKLRRRVQEALALDPDCLGAHLLLADVATAPADALQHARDAVAAGERALAEELATNDHALWYHPVGRTWLMARSLLSDLLWQRGDRQLAIAEARAILERNPGDNQGIRYVLLGWLLQAGSVADIEALLAAHEDEASAMWYFGSALHRFRTEGPTDAATAALQAAIASNPHIVPILAGTVPMPETLPDSYALGSLDEAAVYLNTAFPAWLETAGAIEWAIEVVRQRPAKATAGRKRRR